MTGVKIRVAYADVVKSFLMIFFITQWFDAILWERGVMLYGPQIQANPVLVWMSGVFGVTLTILFQKAIQLSLLFVLFRYYHKLAWVCGTACLGATLFSVVGWILLLP
jgi:hypothetical protein